MLRKIKNFFKNRRETQELGNWYTVSWDDEFIYQNVSPPGKNPWSDSFRWRDIERICFEATDLLYSDDLYFFTSARPESHVIPIESRGGDKLWEEVLERELFDAELAIEAAIAVEGLFCWPNTDS